MKSGLGIAVALALLTAPNAAQSAKAPLFDIAVTGVRHEPDGGCKIDLALDNHDNETLRISGNVYIVDLTGTSIGEAYFSFPPVIQNGKSLTTANFYKFKVAGGQCPVEMDVKVAPEYCFVVGSDAELSADYCKDEWTFNVRRQS